MNDIESVKVEKKPGRGHFFCEKAPLLVMVFGAIFLVIFYPLVGNIAQALLRQVVPSLNADIMDNLLMQSKLRSAWRFSYPIEFFPPSARFLLLGNLAQGEADAASFLVHLDDHDVQDVAYRHHVQRMAHALPAELGDMDQARRLDPDVHEDAEVGDVPYRAAHDGARLDVG